MKKPPVNVLIIAFVPAMIVLWLIGLAHTDSNLTTAFAKNIKPSIIFKTGQSSTWGKTTRISVASDGTEGIYGGHEPSISGDGTFVAFSSYSPNLVNGDENDENDVFVHNTQTGQTTAVSVYPDGTLIGFNGGLAPVISSNGRFIAYTTSAFIPVSSTISYIEIALFDLQTKQNIPLPTKCNDYHTIWASPTELAISADGSLIAFVSQSDNALCDGTELTLSQVFVYDRYTQLVDIVSISSDGDIGLAGDSYNPSISADGRYVAFWSRATNLIDNDNNDEADVFVHDRATDQTIRVSLASDGTEANDFSGSSLNAISADGRYVTFHSTADNLVLNDNNMGGDAFVHDLLTGQTTRISVASDGTETNLYTLSFSMGISPDGRYISFQSDSDNLVENDNNEVIDIFVYDTSTGQTARVSVASDGSEADNYSISSTAYFSEDSRYVVFDSNAGNLVDNDTNNRSDAFIHGLCQDESCLMTGTYQTYLPMLVR